MNASQPRNMAQRGVVPAHASLSEKAGPTQPRCQRRFRRRTNACSFKQLKMFDQYRNSRLKPAAFCSMLTADQGKYFGF